ncbi:hypothetical protein OF83DRAFT_380509 [Amylostereum chailletii]|nr:hypothetical protein OF83DRAFT_380509 [Amylostereum chailletii]
MSTTNLAHSSKRARTGDSDNQNGMPIGATVTVVHSDDVWMEDGNIVLRAPYKGDSSVILFKAHKFVLATHGAVFRDLFGGPQTAFDVASDRYDGLPVMDMQDDYEDLGDFLKALYYPNFLQRHRQPLKYGLNKADFPKKYAGILRLSRKYDAQDIRDLAVDALHEDWPAELRLWDAREAVCDFLGIDLIVDGEETRNENAPLHYPDPAQTIRLATDHDIPSVLPIAFYDLARVYEFKPFQAKNPRTADLSCLTTEDFQRFVRGRAALRSYVHTFRHRPFILCPRGDGTSPCLKELRKFWSECCEEMNTSSDPLECLKRAEDSAGGLVACSDCRSSFVGGTSTARRTLFKRLKTFFDREDNR